MIKLPLVMCCIRPAYNPPYPKLTCHSLLVGLVTRVSLILGNRSLSKDQMDMDT